ncbi:MAG: DUF2304 domain-containing protein [Bacteroidales bacterium]|nr:DUF2304 domain-containing protein [Bacteroidales bacterium]
MNIQYIAITGSILLLFFVLHLIRKKSLKEEYSLLWLFFCFVFLFFSIWRDGLDYFAQLIGIAYAPAALFFIFLLAILMILIEFSIIISKLSDKSKNLAQEIGILKMEIEKLKKQTHNPQPATRNP